MIILVSILAKNPNCTFESYGWEDAGRFEQCSDVADIPNYIQNYLLTFLTGDEDLVVVQLGDNVSAANTPVFAESCPAAITAIRNKCPHAKIIWPGIWFSTSEKMEIVRTACAEKGAIFADISGMYEDRQYTSYIGAVIHMDEIQAWPYTLEDVSDVVENTPTNITVTFGNNKVSTINVTEYNLNGTTLSYKGYEQIVKHPAVAAHPGDGGMAKIAEIILNAIGI